MKKANTYYYFSLACAIWFLATSSIWVYLINVIISFPVGVAGFLLMRTGKKTEGRTNRFKTIENILIIGCCISFIVLLGLMLYN